MMCAVWYMDHKGRATYDGVYEVKDPSTYSQTDANGDTQPVTLYDKFPDFTPPEGFFMVRLQDHG